MEDFQVSAVNNVEATGAVVPADLGRFLELFVHGRQTDGALGRRYLDETDRGGSGSSLCDPDERRGGTTHERQVAGTAGRRDEVDVVAVAVDARQPAGRLRHADQHQPAAVELDSV